LIEIQAPKDKFVIFGYVELFGEERKKIKFENFEKEINKLAFRKT
jgi:hypothetical protein